MLVMCTCQSVNRQCLVSIFHSSSGIQSIVQQYQYQSGKTQITTV